MPICRTNGLTVRKWVFVLSVLASSAAAFVYGHRTARGDASCSLECHEYAEWGQMIFDDKWCYKYTSWEAKDGGDVFHCKNANCKGGTKGPNSPYKFDFKVCDQETCDLLCADCTLFSQEAANTTGCTVKTEDLDQHVCNEESGS